MNKVKKIPHEVLRAKIDEKANFVLLETTPAEKFEVGHLPGAKNLPTADIESRASALIPGKDSKVVVYGMGSNGDTSKEAARKLASMGYTKIYRFAGGRAEWNATKTPAAAV